MKYPVVYISYLNTYNKCFILKKIQAFLWLTRTWNRGDPDLEHFAPSGSLGPKISMSPNFQRNTYW